MLRRISLGVVVFSVTSVVMAVPLPREVPHAPNLAGTTWSGWSHGRRGTYRFDKGGILDYSGDSDGKGTWKQEGDLVIFDINDYSFHKGRIGPHTIDIESSNRGGANWSFQLKREKDVKADH